MLVRIKTEEEFIKEFGEDWRNKTQRPFTKSMDYLFGRQFDIFEEQYVVIIKKKCATVGSNTLSLDMIEFLPDRPMLDMVEFLPDRPMKISKNINYILI